MPKGKRKSKGKSKRRSEGYSEEARIAWHEAAARSRSGTNWESVIQIGCFFIIPLIIALYVVVGLVRADTPDTQQEKLEKQLDQGQREVCRKWGNTVDGC